MLPPVLVRPVPGFHLGNDGIGALVYGGESLVLLAKPELVGWALAGET